MGWTYTHRGKGLTTRQFLEYEFSWGPGERHEIMADGSSNGAYYAAVRDNEAAGCPVMAIVVLTRWASNDYHNFGYKEMDETMGPWEAQAPPRVLDVLSPTDDDIALDWRARCRAYIERRAFNRQVQPGTEIRLLESVEFDDGRRLDTLELVDRAKGLFRVSDRPQSRYRLRDWTTRPLVIVSTGAESPPLSPPSWSRDRWRT